MWLWYFKSCIFYLRFFKFPLVWSPPPPLKLEITVTFTADIMIILSWCGYQSLVCENGEKGQLYGKKGFKRCTYTPSIYFSICLFCLLGLAPFKKDPFIWHSCDVDHIVMAPLFNLSAHPFSIRWGGIWTAKYCRSCNRVSWVCPSASSSLQNSQGNVGNF
jgi:hypothetical protein